MVPHPLGARPWNAGGLVFLLGPVVVFMFAFVLAIDINAGFWWLQWSQTHLAWLGEHL
jgi:hypothetical protein